MAEEHRATPGDWAQHRKWASPPYSDPHALCLLELLHRINRLEQLWHVHDAERQAAAAGAGLAIEQMRSQPGSRQQHRGTTTHGSNPQPPVDGEVAELAEWLHDHALNCRELGRNDWAAQITRTAELLQHLESDNAGLTAAADSAFMSLLDY